MSSQPKDRQTEQGGHRERGSGRASEKRERGRGRATESQSSHAVNATANNSQAAAPALGRPSLDHGLFFCKPRQQQRRRQQQRKQRQQRRQRQKLHTLQLSCSRELASHRRDFISLAQSCDREEKNYSAAPFSLSFPACFSSFVVVLFLLL